MEALSAKYFPGVPVIPSMPAFATDGLHLSAVGIPTYGVPGAWSDPDGREFVGVGIQPQVRVEPRLADFRAGRDTVLEAALGLLRKGAR
jgi:hypothetical protein